MDRNPIDRDLTRLRRILPLPGLGRGNCPFRSEAERDFSRRTAGNPHNENVDRLKFGDVPFDVGDRLRRAAGHLGLSIKEYLDTYGLTHVQDMPWVKEHLDTYGLTHVQPTDATYREYTCADVGDFRAVRSVIMTNAWARAHGMEAGGRRLSNRVFGNLVEDEWDKAKAKAKECGVDL